MGTKGPTVVERILLAALELGEEGRSFTAEDLIVRAWKLSSQHFGLQGYAELYPDSNRVLTKLMGKGSTLRRKGWLRKIGEKRYRLTDLGRAAATELIATNSETTVPRRLAGVGRKLLSPLSRMLESSAYRRFVKGEPLTFGDVCGFWNVSPRSSAHQLAAQLEMAEAAIREADIAVRGEGDGRVEIPGSSLSIDSGDVARLKELSIQLREQFEREIAVIQARTDERRL